MHDLLLSGRIMNHKLDLNAIAHELKAAQDQCWQVEPYTSRLNGFGNDEAYAVAQMIHQMRVCEGSIPVGRKIGFTNPDMWSFYEVHEPIWGYMYDSSVVRLSNSRAQCRIDHFAEPKIEPEIVFHFRSSPPVGIEPREILACIDWIAHGIEIVQSHFPSWKFRSPDTIADGGLHATLFVGEPVEVKRLGPGVIYDLERFTIALSCDGTVLERGRGSNALGNPLNAVAHLIAVLSKQPHTLAIQEGELVTTGTLTTALPILTGQAWTTNLDGISLPGISVSF
jgi:2-oxo-3-hexenedioate decarboxylase